MNNKEVSKLTKISDDLYAFSTWDRETLQILTMSVGKRKTMLAKAKKNTPSLSDWRVLILQLYSAGSFDKAIKQNAAKKLNKDREMLPIISEKIIRFRRRNSEVKQKFNSIAEVDKVKRSLESYLRD